MTRLVAASDVLAEDVASICERLAGHLEALEGSSVLIAGGAGFVPGYIVEVLVAANRGLLREPCRIVVVDNLVTGTSSWLERLRDDPNVTFRDTDISRGVPVEEDVHFVVHGASIASPTLYRRRPLETIDVNVTGTRHLLDLAVHKEVEGFLYLSSSEIYGDPPPDWIPTPEEYRGNVACDGPRACYDESKRLAETLCFTYHRMHGTPVTIARPFNVYGPRLRLDDGRVVPDLIRNVVRGEALTILSDGRATRSFCYVTDAIVAMLLLLLKGRRGEAYNVGHDEEVSIGELAETLDRGSRGGQGVRFGRSDDPDYLTDNPQRRCPDLTKTRAAIPWEPVVGLASGLDRTLRYYLESVP